MEMQGQSLNKYLLSPSWSASLRRAGWKAEVPLQLQGLALMAYHIPFFWPQALAGGSCVIQDYPVPHVLVRLFVL
jgi:hypothetical protein